MDDKLPRRSDREPTASLVARAARGEAGAENELVRRYWGALRNWGHGRLPPAARERLDTEDLVQLTLLKALKRLGTFEPTRTGAFTAYLHQALLNTIRDEIRRAGRRPDRRELGEDIAADAPGPLDKAMDAEFVAAYEAALRRLPEDHQRAVVLRLELGHTFAEIAAELKRPSANATRMLVSRALQRMAGWMKEPG